MSETVFGLTQLVPPLVAVGILLLSGSLAPRLGKKRMALLGLTMLGFALSLLSVAGDLIMFVLAMCVSGLGFALVEAAMNSAALDWEHALKRDVMNVMHAGFSGGGMLGAFLAGVLLQFGWDYPAILQGIAGIAVLFFVLTLPVQYPPDTAGDAHAAGAGGAIRLVFGTLALALMAMLALMGVIGESVASSWSVIYLRQLGAEAFIGGAGFAIFNAAMFAGRLLNAPLAARKGARFSLLLSGALVTIAGILMILTTNVWIVILAFGLTGLGVAGVVPTALSAAARMAPGNSAAITGGVMATAYAGFIFCPPLVGFVADAISLQAALLSVALSGIVLLLLARRTAR
jgi:MFS family permease